MSTVQHSSGTSIFRRAYNTLMYPQTCKACDKRLIKNESLLCLRCLHTLPKTKFHLEKNNLITLEFAGRIKLEKAAAFLYYNKGSKVQQMMWQLKYQGQQDLGVMLGKLYGEDLVKSDFMNDIDIILSVPLHKRKLADREFNQADLLAQGLSEETNVPWSGDLLSRTVYTETQTKKTRAERWENVAGTFKVNKPEFLADKHILLVDDVVTTGTTLQACGQSILQIPNTKLSIACAATAIQL